MVFPTIVPRPATPRGAGRRAAAAPAPLLR